MSRGPVTDPLAEEPWEAEIGAMLGGLPPVAPPAGFIDAALDHRPLHAGRTVGLLGGLVAVAVIAAVLTGVARRAAVVPPIDELVVLHDKAAQTGLVADLTSDGQMGTAGSDDLFDLPPGFHRAGTLAAEDIRQAVYARGDESVSVFVQEGRLAWSFLAADGLTDLAGLPAWVDRDRQVAVLETDGRTITIVGLSIDELTQTLDDLPQSSRSSESSLHDLAEAIIVQLGYAPID